MWQQTRRSRALNVGIAVIVTAVNVDRKTLASALTPAAPVLPTQSQLSRRASRYGQVKKWLPLLSWMRHNTSRRRCSHH